MSDTRNRRDPPPLSSEYHKARKQLLLWAAILLIWAFIGVDLERAEKTGGNIGTVITAIKSPQAVPWVLIILVLYFLFKTSVEWFQCSRSRRSLPVARTDFISAWVVSLIAMILYFGQSISKVQLADQIQHSARLQSFLQGLFWGFAGISGFLTTTYVSAKTISKAWLRWSLWVLSAAICMTVVFLAQRVLMAGRNFSPSSTMYKLYGVGTIFAIYIGWRTLWPILSRRFAVNSPRVSETR